MKDQFVPYELALKLKELGFNQECLAYYYKHGNSKKEKLFYYPSQDEYDIDDHPYLEPNSKTNSDAPLWQQAFDWFREMHELIYNITFKDDNYKFSYGNINSATNLYMPQYPTYEEARFACLKKLIELVSSV